jgi:cyclopropane fatty-acyl-phospholipid synthase-like methyltransferase
MTSTGGPKTPRAHWETTWSRAPRPRLPSVLWVGVRNLQRVLRSRVRPGMSVLEIGCAPGKTLAWLAKVLDCRVAGLDYSDRGLSFARKLFGELGIEGDLRCEALDATTFAPGSFDLVFSDGVIEHFEDPSEIVRQHVALTKPGGETLIVVPNYAGLYGRIQAHFDPANLLLHNVAIMTPEALVELRPRDMVTDVRAYATGYLSPWLINFDKRWPRAIARGISYVLNGAGVMQPFEIASLCPSLVLEMRRQA